MTKQEALHKIQGLVAKYRKVELSRSTKKYTEEETKKDFILPMFQALGWDIFDKNEVSAEEAQSGGRVDYGFYLNGRLKFYLEAKSLKTDLNREDYANQAIKYSWNKGATWSILTDFEGLKVFNAQVIDRQLGDKLYFQISVGDYVERFDQLWQLSKEAFAKNLIDEEAEKIGKKLQRVPVEASLYKDLTKCRDLLTDKLAKMNPQVDGELLDEGVQKLLDRLIFIRVAEDRGVERPTLVPLIRAWESSKNPSEVPLYKSMVSKFRELDNIYNSNLFTPHPLENWQDWSNTTEQVVKILQGKPGYYEYDFKVISSDVLGSVYENYLGYRLLKSKNGLTLSKDAKKRKEHGIYYTPDYIVDYIVRNSLQPILDKCKSLEELKKVKVLDPACGSGSFLIKALDLFSKKYRELDRRGRSHTKMSILVNNIYGVDLDYQAVEITKLNLLLNVLNSRARMPSLENNIKNGNSLISGTDEELEEYFGKSFREKKPFNWEEEFPEVFKQGGFDVIIGNPPYVTSKYEKLSDDVKEYLKNSYLTAYDKFDLYTFFFERSINLLKNGGLLGFITPWNFLNNLYSFKLRKFILDNCNVVKITKTAPGVFPNVVVDTAISILQRCRNERERKDNTIDVNEISTTGYVLSERKINQNQFIVNEKNIFNIQVGETPYQLYKKILHDSFPLGKLTLNYIGIMTGGNAQRLSDMPKFKRSEKILIGKDIGRYFLNYANRYVDFDPLKLHSNTNERVFLASPKILLRKTGDTLIATLDGDKFFTLQSLYNIIFREKSDYDLKYILAILNSKLQTYIYRNMFITNPKVFPYIKRKHLDQLPIHKIDFSKKNDKDKHDEIVRFVDKILSLSRSLKLETQNSEKWKSLKSEIERIDKSIDEKVNKLYNLTLEEIKIVEKI